MHICPSHACTLSHDIISRESVTTRPNKLVPGLKLQNPKPQPQINNPKKLKRWILLGHRLAPISGCIWYRKIKACKGFLRDHSDWWWTWIQDERLLEAILGYDVRLRRWIFFTKIEHEQGKININLLETSISFVIQFYMNWYNPVAIIDFSNLKGLRVGRTLSVNQNNIFLMFFFLASCMYWYTVPCCCW